MVKGKSQDLWYIWVLAVVAVVVTVLALSKDKAQQSSAPAAVTAPAAEISAPEPVTPSPMPQATEVGIKPAHEQALLSKAAGVVEPLKQVTPRDTYAIQVYSFKQKGRAEAAMKALKDKGYSAYIMVSDLGPRGIWYRVRVGTYNNETEAQTVLDSVTRDFKSGIIVSE